MAEDSSVLIETGEQAPQRPCMKYICPLLVAIGILSLSTAVLVSYFQATYNDGVPVRILALNTWGMPELFGSKDKEKRMPAIGKLVAKQEYDIYLFEELWLRKDHQIIKDHLPEGYTMTTYDSMNQSPCPDDPLTPFLCCDGVATPSGCSGLAAVSRYPVEGTHFTIYNDHGPMEGGEKLARKGFGRIRVTPAANITMDVFVTHTCASDTVADKKARENQVAQLLKSVRTSKADFKLLGGDFNSDPRAVTHGENTYLQLKKDMSSSMEEFFKRITEWLIPSRATYGNPRNTYSNMYQPVLYDYIWHRTQPGNLVLTNLFDIPFLTTNKLLTTENPANSTLKSAKGADVKPGKSTTISLSDHEAVSASLLLFKKK